MYGEYPRIMQVIVGNRLPKFTKEEVKMVKGSIDFVGINQYTTNYIYDPHQSKPKVLSYQQDWNTGFACKILHSSLRMRLILSFIYSKSELLSFVTCAVAKRGVPIGPRVSLSQSHLQTLIAHPKRCLF